MKFSSSDSPSGKRRLLPMVAVAAGLFGLVGLVLLIRGCSDRSSVTTVDASREEVVRFELPPANSPGTVRGLGPHLWEATFDRRAGSQGSQVSRDTVARLVWAELDRYHFLQIDNGQLVHDEVRVDRDLYRRASDEEMYKQSLGISGDSMILQRTLMLWDQAIAPFAAQMSYDRQPDAVLEGRPVRIYKLGLAPIPALDSQETVKSKVAAQLQGIVVTPIQLNGVSYVDIETGNRLLVELEGSYLPRGERPDNQDPTDDVRITYRESRSLTGVPVEISRPRSSKVRKPR